MKRSIIASLVCTALAASPIAALAQPHPPGRGGPPPSRPGPGPGMHAGNHGPGGPIPHRDWRRGQRLPQAYRGHSYVVDNWREHGLRPPPRGYHWVGVNGDYVLVAIASGVISSILMSSH